MSTTGTGATTPPPRRTLASLAQKAEQIAAAAAANADRAAALEAGGAAPAASAAASPYFGAAAAAPAVVVTHVEGSGDAPAEAVGGRSRSHSLSGLLSGAKETFKGLIGSSKKSSPAASPTRSRSGSASAEDAAAPAAAAAAASAGSSPRSGSGLAPAAASPRSRSASTGAAAAAAPAGLESASPKDFDGLLAASNEYFNVKKTYRMTETERNVFITEGRKKVSHLIDIVQKKLKNCNGKVLEGVDKDFVNNKATSDLEFATTKQEFLYILGDLKKQNALLDAALASSNSPSDGDGRPQLSSSIGSTTQRLSEAVKVFKRTEKK